MLLAYLLLFLLHLSASTCDATSRNHRIFLNLRGAAVGAPSPAIHDHHRRIAKDLFHDALYPLGMMGATPPPPPSLPGVEGMRRPDEATINAATMAPSPSPSPLPQDNDNGAHYGEPRGGGDVVSGGYDGEGGPPPPPSVAITTATEQEESSAGDDVSVDYAGPKTHPPSHN